MGNIFKFLKEKSKLIKIKYNILSDYIYVIKKFKIYAQLYNFYQTNLALLF